MADRLKGKVAVVTGAAPRGEGVGNGMATAILFAREGAKVVLVNRSAERAEKLAKQIKDEGGEASVFAGDVAKADACRGDGRVRGRRPTAGSTSCTTMSASARRARPRR